VVLVVVVVVMVVVVVVVVVLLLMGLLLSVFSGYKATRVPQRLGLIWRNKRWRNTHKT